MVGAGIVVTGLDDLQNSLKRVSNPKIYDEIVNDVADHAVIYAKQYVPIRTGNLMQSIKKRKMGTGSFEVYSDVDYASYQEFGTRYLPSGDEESPYVYTSSSGKSAYRPFMRPAALKALRDVEKAFDKNWGKAWMG